MRIRVGDVHLFFDVEGLKLVPEGAEMIERPTVILIHGGPGSDHTPFKPLMSPLADTAQLVYIDLRGSGRSDEGKPADWEWDRWGDDIAAFCEAAEIDDPVLLGTSGGAWVALCCELDHPGLARGLILASAMPSPFDESIAVFERTGGPTAAAIARRWFAGEPGEEILQAWTETCIPLFTRRSPQALSSEVLARVRSNPAVIERNQTHQMRPFDVWDRLHEITCSTLVLASEDDPMTGVREAERLVDALVNAPVQFVRYENCGHGVFREVPNEALAAARRFLGSLT